MFKPRLCGAFLLVAFLCSLAAAQNTVRHYRYELNMRSQDLAYAHEVPATAGGGHWAVTRDAAGRIIQVANVRDGKVVDKVIYKFAAGKKLPDSYESYRDGELTGKVALQRNASGERVREEYFTADGVRTRYNTYSYQGDSAEQRSYTAEDKLKSIYALTYGSNSHLLGWVDYSNPDDRTSHLDTEYDESTGLIKARKQIKANAIVNTRALSYDSNGELVREDAYDASGKPFVFLEWKDGLQTRRAYFADGKMWKELKYTYSARQRERTDLYSNGVFICKFVYDRLGDGTVKATRAIGPNGELWAEYPDNQVLDIQQDGRPLDGKATIHHAGKWY
jgi:antitoxin component YwqK of YwqJK toxin-antitoxin module